MTIILGNEVIQGAANIAGGTSNYGIVQDSTGRVKLPYIPSFYAYGIGGGTFASGSYMIFPTTRYNVGSNYNTADGKFTAPVAGTYVFYWSFIGNTSDTVYRQTIRKNGANLSNGRQLRLDTTISGANQYGSNYAQTTLVTLAANEYIQIYYTSDNATACYPGANSATDAYLYFTGYLLG